MDTEEIALFCLTSLLLFLALMISLRQCLCITRVDNKPKLWKIYYVLIYIVIGITLNTLYYLILDPQQAAMHIFSDQLDLYTFTYIFEAIYVTYAFHVGRFLGYSVVHKLYLMVDNLTVPKYINFTFYLAQFLVTISAIMCYSFALFVSDNFVYIYIFYIIMEVIVVFLVIEFAVVLRKLLCVLDAVGMHQSNVHRIEASKRAVKGTVIVVAVIGLSTLADIFADFEAIYHPFSGYGVNQALINCVLHSGLVIGVGAVFMLLVIDDNRKFCAMHKYSICVVFCGFESKRKKKRKIVSKNQALREAVRDVTGSGNEALLIMQSTTDTAGSVND